MIRPAFIFGVRLGVVCMLAILTSPAENLSRISSVAGVRAISNPTAAQSIRVAVEGTVTYFEAGNVDLFLQDGNAAVYVEVPPNLSFETGDRVLVEGLTRASFRPEIQAQKVTLLRHGTPPPPVEANFAELIRADLDCRRVRVRAVVRAAELFTDGPNKSLLLDLQMPGGPIQAQIADRASTSERLNLLDSTIEITGAVAGEFDSKSHITGILLEVPSFADLRIVRTARHSPEGTEVRHFDEVIHSLRIDDSSERVRVNGKITYYQPGAAMVLQDGTNALWVDTLTEESYRVGEEATVSGFPSVRNGSVVLTQAAVERTRPGIPPDPAISHAAQLASGSHAFELVSVEGELIMRVREQAQDQYIIRSQQRLISAIYRHPERGLNLSPSPLLSIPLGSLVRVSGICVLDRGDQFRGSVAFHLLLRSSQDVSVLKGPSIISVRNLSIVLGFLLLSVFAAVTKAWLLERKLRRKDVATAQTIERWRTRVIEGINSSVPIQDTLLQITELLSFKLQVQYCWIELEEEGTFGRYPGALERASLKIIEREISAQSGTLGKISIACEMGKQEIRIGADAFSNAIRLAALAIETNSKYSELVRRSEVDSLTNVKNRFAFDRALKLLDREPSRRSGLIYIDLDDFKLINDEFGHSVGDLYLQNVALRLEHQLRAQDTLARVGGDEFAVVISSLNDRKELEEIAERLQSCFARPFHLGIAEISGSASIGCAMSPEEATTSMELLNCADAKMYREKNRKRRQATRNPEEKLPII